MTKKQRLTIILCYLMYSQSIHSHPFPDYGTAYELILTREFILAIGLIAILYVNRACWKTSYENTHAQRHRYEMLYLDMTQKYLTQQIKNTKLENELKLLKRTAVKPNETIRSSNYSRRTL